MNPRAEVWVGGGIAVVGIAIQPLIALGQALGLKLTTLQLIGLVVLTVIVLLLGFGMIAHGLGAGRLLRAVQFRSPIIIARPKTGKDETTEPSTKLAGARSTRSLHTGPPILIVKCDHDLDIRVQSPDVYIAIINNAERATFHAKVLEVRNVKFEPAVPWTVPWREGGGSDTRTLEEGEVQLHALGKGDAMGNLVNPRQGQGIHAGLFHFRTPDGTATVPRFAHSIV